MTKIAMVIFALLFVGAGLLGVGAGIYGEYWNSPDATAISHMAVLVSFASIWAAVVFANIE